MEIGWFIDVIGEANRFPTPPVNMTVVDHGRLVIAWGDSARRVKLSSIRKSLLRALYGAPVRDGPINLDDTLEQVGIDDDPPLTPSEKEAMFLSSFGTAIRTRTERTRGGASSFIAYHNLNASIDDPEQQRAVARAPWIAAREALTRDADAALP